MKKLVCILFVLFSANFAIAQETIYIGPSFK